MTTETINPTGYTIAELKQSVEPGRLRSPQQAERRQSIVAKKLARLYAEEARLEKEQIELCAIIEAAWKEIHK